MNLWPLAPDPQPTDTGTRVRIIEAARELFHSQGFRRTSLAMVSRRAQANPGSLYHFFKSKDELLIAVLERYRELLWPVVMAPAFARTGDPIERIFAILDAYRQLLIDTDFAIGCPIGNLTLELTDAETRVQAWISANLDAWSAVVSGCLDECADPFGGPVDRKRLATFVLVVMEGAVLLARGHRSIQPFDDAVAQLRHYFSLLATNPIASTFPPPESP